MHRLQEDVREFQRKFDLFIGSAPMIPTDDVVNLWTNLVEEEYGELEAACDYDDIVAIADAIGDLIWVTLGLANAYGIDMAPIWQAIKVGNMAKEGGDKRADGKILKPKGWTPPDIVGLLKLQGLKID